MVHEAYREYTNGLKSKFVTHGQLLYPLELCHTAMEETAVSFLKYLSLKRVSCGNAVIQVTRHYKVLQLQLHGAGSV